MNRDWGIVRPLYGRWVWPYKMMEEGDWFLVAREDRSPEYVRHFTSVRAAQLGKRFKVEKHPQDHPGFTKVECMPDDYEVADHNRPALEYGSGRERLRDIYGFEMDTLDFGQIERGGVVRYQLPALDPDEITSNNRWVIQLWPKSAFDLGVELHLDHLTFQAVSKGWKPHIWKAKSDWWEAEGRAALAKSIADERNARQGPTLSSVLD